MSRTNETEVQRAVRWMKTINQCKSLLDQMSVEMMALAEGVAHSSTEARVSGIWNHDTNTMLVTTRSGQGYLLTLTASAFSKLNVGDGILAEVISDVGFRWPPIVIHAVNAGPVSPLAYASAWGGEVEI